jgi:hypothetical protein
MTVGMKTAITSLTYDNVVFIESTLAYRAYVVLQSIIDLFF